MDSKSAPDSLTRHADPVQNLNKRFCRLRFGQGVVGFHVAQLWESQPAAYPFLHIVI